MPSAITVTSKKLRGHFPQITSQVNGQRPVVTYVTLDGTVMGVLVSLKAAEPVLTAHPQWDQQAAGMTDFRENLAEILRAANPPKTSEEEPMATYLTYHGHRRCVLLPPVAPYEASKAPGLPSTRTGTRRGGRRAPRASEQAA